MVKRYAVTIQKEYIVEIDERILTPEFREEMKNFWELDKDDNVAFEELAKHAAHNRDQWKNPLLRHWDTYRETGLG